jgi:hypothetical protein
MSSSGAARLNLIPGENGQDALCPLERDRVIIPRTGDEMHRFAWAIFLAWRQRQYPDCNATFSLDTADTRQAITACRVLEHVAV